MKRLIVATPIVIMLVALFAVRVHAETLDLSSGHHVFLPQVSSNVEQSNQAPPAQKENADKPQQPDAETTPEPPATTEPDDGKEADGPIFTPTPIILDEPNPTPTREPASTDPKKDAPLSFTIVMTDSGSSKDGVLTICRYDSRQNCASQDEDPAKKQDHREAADHYQLVELPNGEGLVEVDQEIQLRNIFTSGPPPVAEFQEVYDFGDFILVCEYNDDNGELLYCDIYA